MLVLRDSQVESLRKSLDEPFVAWMAGQLLTTHIELVAHVGEAALRCTIHDALGAARRAGLQSPTALATFAEFWISRGDAVTSHSCFLKLLAVPGASAEAHFFGQLARGEWT
jgi:hypothetical protein